MKTYLPAKAVMQRWMGEGVTPASLKDGTASFPLIYGIQADVQDDLQISCGPRIHYCTQISHPQFSPYCVRPCKGSCVFCPEPFQANLSLWNQLQHFPPQPPSCQAPPRLLTAPPNGAKAKPWLQETNSAWTLAEGNENCCKILLFSRKELCY